MTRFLPGFNHILCGRPPKSARAQLKQKLAHLRESTLSELSDLFDRWIPLGVLQPKSEKENSRERVYSLRTTFWGFLFQVLSPQTACREVVRKVQSYCSERELNSILDFLMSHLFSFIVTNEQLVKIERCYKVTLNAAF